MNTEARDTLRDAADTMRLLRLDHVQAKLSDEAALRCDVVAEKLRDDL